MGETLRQEEPIDSLPPEEVPDAFFRRQLRVNKELQVKAFGREFNDDEFERRFGGEIKPDDIRAVERVFGAGELTDREIKASKSKWAEATRQRRASERKTK